MGFDAVKKTQKHVFFQPHLLRKFALQELQFFLRVVRPRTAPNSPFTIHQLVWREASAVFHHWAALQGQVGRVPPEPAPQRRRLQTDSHGGQIFRENMGFKWFFYLMFDHPHFRSIDVGKIGFIAATSPKIGVTWLLECWMTGVPSLFRTIRSYYFSSGAMEPWNAGPCRVDDRSPKCLKSILSLFLKILGQNSPAYLFFWQQS